MHRSEVQKVWIIASLQTLIPHGSGAACSWPRPLACSRKTGLQTPRLETAKGCHKVIDLAGRRSLTGFEVALDA